MVEFGTMRCRAAAFVGLLLLTASMAGCSTVGKTFDFKADPELQRKGAYPNINDSATPQPGTAMTPEEQEAAKAALVARAAAASPAIGAAAKQQGAQNAAELEELARTQSEQAQRDLEARCADGTAPDATKCPQ